ncbi:hypothetical protein ACFV9C_06595 [Kribbella sp. NPDC059898]|uniref:hypothetical protein n=1 Tax=Kribbella sp. NPDC059898 TaxID=3346995 RepID=UPI003666A23C
MTAALVVGYLVTIGAVVDAARRPSYAWVVADRNRGYWIGGLVFGLLLVPVGVAMAIGYVVGVVPRLGGSSDSGPFRRQP